jgi:hypothetical protein
MAVATNWKTQDGLRVYDASDATSTRDIMIAGPDGHAGESVDVNALPPGWRMLSDEEWSVISVQFEITSIPGPSGTGYTDVILVEGFCDGKSKIYGIFADAEDARSGFADDLALGTVGRESLTAEQIALAERNSDRL